MSVRFQFCMALILLVVNVPDSAAWGPQGHRVIGLIAENHLEPEVKELIAKKFNINSLAGVANWADRTRKSEKKKAPGITPILKRDSGLMTLKGIVPTGPVSRRKFMSFQAFCLTAQSLCGKERMR